MIIFYVTNITKWLCVLGWSRRPFYKRAVLLSLLIDLFDMPTIPYSEWWFSQWRHQIAKSKKRGFTNSYLHYVEKQKENISLYKFLAPKHVSFRKYSNLNFGVFTVRDTKIGMLSHWKKSVLLIQQVNHFSY